MRQLKRIAISLLLTGGVFGANAASAGIPVIDAANLAQSIQQVIAWAEQQIQMATQINNQIQHYKAITGSRNLGTMFNNQLLQQIIPANAQSVMSAINTGGYAGLTPQAKIIRNTTMIYNCMDKPAGQLRTSCQAVLSGPAQAQAYSSSALNTAQQRVAEIQSMQNQINTTTDPKAIAEVQAALAAEQAQVQNDAIRVALAKQMQDTQALQAEMALREKEMSMMAPNAPTTFDNYTFP
jgi:type IV secretion system protein VirB5